MTERLDVWQAVFFAAATIIVCYQVLRGWHLGFARQMFSLLALAGAYIVAIFGGELAVPVLRPVGYPDMVTQLASGAILASFVYFGINAIGTVVFKKGETNGQGSAKLSHSLAGSMIGFVFAGFTVWLALLAIRLLGTVAEAEVRHMQTVPKMAAVDRSVPERSSSATAPGVNSVVRGLANMKQSLESGSTGAVVNYIDPVPIHVYNVLRKVAQLLAQPERADLFLSYPGAKTITDHPKIAALRADPAITQNLLAQNYLALLHNENIVSAANDPEIGALVMNFRLEEALDYALKAPGPSSAPH